MGKLSVQQYAALAGCSRQRVNELILDGRLVRGSDKKMDTDAPLNAQFLKDRAAARGAGINGQAPPANKGASWRSGTAEDVRNKIKEHYEGTKSEAGNGYNFSMDNPEDILSNIDADEVLSRLSSVDIRNLSPADVGKVARLESALKTRVERQKKRGELIDRTIVQNVFGKLHTIDVNEWRTLGARLAPDIASIAQVDEPEKILQIERAVDDEVIKVLTHVKYTLGEFLRTTEVSADV